MQGVVRKGRENLVPFNNIDKNCFTVGTHNRAFYMHKFSYTTAPIAIVFFNISAVVLTTVCHVKPPT